MVVKRSKERRTRYNMHDPFQLPRPFPGCSTIGDRHRGTPQLPRPNSTPVWVTASSASQVASATKLPPKILSLLELIKRISSDATCLVIRVQADPIFLGVQFQTSAIMDAIKKKMQAMKVEKDNAMDRSDVCEQAAKDAKVAK